ncbi:MAG TPA: SRPBCC domain-containing protein, partial [Actinomycetota bacterium]|nr:SRPBCC domain-containing protein [Actinomycetota bacterium]
ERPIDVAFKLFTDGIDEWWPDGYSVGGYGSTTILESFVGGRFVQRSKAGQEFELGRVTICEPPSRIVMTWAMPQWDGETEIEVNFRSEGSATVVELEHRGWENVGKFADDFRHDYDIGWDDILPRYVTSSGGLSPTKKKQARAKEVERKPATLPASVKKALESPPADGLLVHTIHDEKAAAGIKEGDVITAFNKIKVKQWADYYKVHCSVTNTQVVPLAVNRGGKQVTIETLRTWIAATNAPFWPVSKGRRVELRPEDTGARFDFARLTDSPIDKWYRINNPKGKKMGFEHHVLKRVGKNIEFFYETAYESMGRQHAKIWTKFTAAPRPKPIESRMENLITGQVVTGKRATTNGKAVWKVTDERDGRIERSRFPLGSDAMFSMGTQVLAGFLDQKDGAVMAWTPIDEYSGSVGLGVATICRGAEAIATGRTKLEAWKYELINVGRVGTTGWFAGKVLVRLDSSGSVVATTQEDATKGFV